MSLDNLTTAELILILIALTVFHALLIATVVYLWLRVAFRLLELWNEAEKEDGA